MRFKLNLSNNDGGVSPGPGNIGPGVSLGSAPNKCNFYFSAAAGVPMLRYDSPANGQGKLVKTLTAASLGVDEWFDVDLKLVPMPADAGTAVEVNGADAGILTACTRAELTRARRARRRRDRRPRDPEALTYRSAIRETTFGNGVAARGSRRS